VLLFLPWRQVQEQKGCCNIYHTSVNELLWIPSLGDYIDDDDDAVLLLLLMMMMMTTMMMCITTNWIFLGYSKSYTIFILFIPCTVGNILDTKLGAKICPLHSDVIAKVKWSRYRPGVVQRVGRSLPLLFYDRGSRRGWVVSSTPRPHFTPRERPSTHFTGGWVGPRGRSGRAENLVPTGIRSRTVQSTHIYVIISNLTLTVIF